MEQTEFQGRKILVLGASSGIGRACAIQLGRREAKVILVGRNQERLEETADQIPEGLSTILPCDISDFDAAQQVVKDAVALDGIKLDGCVFSVGIGKVVPIASVKEQAFLEVFQTNFFPLYGVMKSFLSRRVSEDGASFVSISSIAGINAPKGQCIYGPAKAAMNSFISVAAQELAKRRIRVNAVCPDMVETPMGIGLHLFTPEYLQTYYPLGVLEPDDIADTVLYLLSDASRKITGQAIAITAGFTGGNINFQF